MVKQQPTALRLVDELLQMDKLFSHPGTCGEAATELRRLHGENVAQRKALRAYISTIDQFHHAVADAGWHPGRTDDLLTDIIREKGKEMRRLHKVNQELLEALREMVSGDADAIQEAEALGVPFPDEMLTAYRRAVAAIAKATGDQQ